MASSSSSSSSSSSGGRAPQARHELIEAFRHKKCYICEKKLDCDEALSEHLRCHYYDAEGRVVMPENPLPVAGSLPPPAPPAPRSSAALDGPRQPPVSFTRPQPPPTRPRLSSPSPLAPPALPRPYGAMIRPSHDHPNFCGGIRAGCPSAYHSSPPAHPYPFNPLLADPPRAGFAPVPMSAPAALHASKMAPIRGRGAVPPVDGARPLMPPQGAHTPPLRGMPSIDDYQTNAWRGLVSAYGQHPGRSHGEAVLLAGENSNGGNRDMSRLDQPPYRRAEARGGHAGGGDQREMPQDLDLSLHL